MDVTDLGHYFVEIIVISDSSAPQKALSRRTVQESGEKRV
jgi:hypothetical protein